MTIEVELPTVVRLSEMAEEVESSDDTNTLHKSAYLIEELCETLRDAKEWIDGDDSFSIDYPEEFERLITRINNILSKATGEKE